MKKISIALIVLIIVGITTYYLVFGPKTSPAPDYNQISVPVATSQTPEPQTPAAILTPAVSSGTVQIKNFAFNPATPDIKVGTKVTWINDDSAPHTVTSDSGNLLNSSTLTTGQSFSFTFTNAGSESYHCNIHRNMKGMVTVEN